MKTTITFLPFSTQKIVISTKNAYITISAFEIEKNWSNFYNSDSKKNSKARIKRLRARGQESTLKLKLNKCYTWTSIKEELKPKKKNKLTIKLTFVF